MINASALPQAPKPLGAYSPCLVRDGVGCLSGQLPIPCDGTFTGIIGISVSLPSARRALALATDNILAHLALRYNGESGPIRFGGLLHVAGYLRTVESFTDHAGLMDHVSDRLLAALGKDHGSHTRSVVGVNSLPQGLCAELVVTFSEIM